MINVSSFKNIKFPKDSSPVFLNNRVGKSAFDAEMENILIDYLNIFNLPYPQEKPTISKIKYTFITLKERIYVLKDINKLIHRDGSVLLLSTKERIRLSKFINVEGPSPHHLYIGDVELFKNFNQHEFIELISKIDKLNNRFNSLSIFNKKFKSKMKKLQTIEDLVQFTNKENILSLIKKDLIVSFYNDKDKFNFKEKDLIVALEHFEKIKIKILQCDDFFSYIETNVYNIMPSFNINKSTMFFYDFNKSMFSLKAKDNIIFLDFNC